jgi:hypothetical protein
MKVKIKNSLPLPVGKIEPIGGEPLYEDASGLRWTAQDFAARNGYESTKAFLEALNTPIAPKEVATYD